MTETGLRVGQLAAHLGVSTHALRAWEARYGLFQPRRSSGGYRIYDAQDVRRAEAMMARIASGTTAAEAARLVLRRLPHERPGDRASDPHCTPMGPAAEAVPTAELERWREVLVRGCTRLDEPAVRDTLAEASQRLATDDFVDEVVVPLLRSLSVLTDGSGGMGIAHAFFAGDVVRSALLGRQRRALPMGAPQLWLACPPKELHDLALMAFGLVAADEGWAVRFFGANTPLRSLVPLARRDPPTAIVISATRPGPLRAAALDVAALAEVAPTAVGGPAARRAPSLGIGVPTLIGDIVTEARALENSLHLRQPA